MHTGAAIDLSTAAAERGMFFTMIAPTDGAVFVTDWADGRVVDMARCQVFAAQQVFAVALSREMIGAEKRMAEVTRAHALLAAFLATLRTGDGVGGELPTTGTFIQAIETVGLAFGIALVEAGADLPPTFFARNQAIGAEALARGSTNAKLGTVLLATWATNGTIRTDERVRAICALHSIGAEVAATLACATFGTFYLAG
jgi:hypothetical protein